MTIHRTKHKKDYTVMSNYHFKDYGLSLKAKGLMSLMLSLPDDWDFSLNGLISMCKDNKTSVLGAIEELKSYGYLEITNIPPHKGHNRYSTVWEIHESPILRNSKCDSQNEKHKKRNSKCDSQNQPQSNTNKSNTKELNTYYSLDQKYSLSQDDFTEEEFEESMKRIEEGGY